MSSIFESTTNVKLTLELILERGTEKKRVSITVNSWTSLYKKKHTKYFPRPLSLS